MGDLYTRIIWSAITDLARLAGVALSDLAATSAAAPPASHASDLQVLLEKRNGLMTLANAPGAAVDEELFKRQCGQINRLEGEILGAAPLTQADTLVQLISLSQIVAEGGQPGEEDAKRVLRAAQRHFGMGYVHEAEGSAPAEQAA